MRKSILTKDLNHCIITGSPNVHIHHVFPGRGRRRLSEKYGFIVPLCPELHNMSDMSVHMKPNQGLDLMLKRTCQEYFERKIGTREEFIEQFNKSYL